jgi:hypothetical protein
VALRNLPAITQYHRRDGDMDRERVEEAKSKLCAT